MAAGDFVKEVASAELAGVASSTIAVTVPAGGCAAGNTIVVTVGGFQVASSATDSRGNTYTLLRTAADGTKTSSILAALLSTALQAGDTITVTLAASATNECMLALEFEGNCSVEDSDTSVASSGTNATGIDTPDTATLTQSDDLYVIAVGRDGASTVTLTHTTSGLTDRPSGSSGKVNTSAGTARSLHSAHKRLASTAAVDYQGTLSVARTWGCSVVCLKVATAGGPTYNDSPSGTATLSGSSSETAGSSQSAIPASTVSAGGWTSSGAASIWDATNDPGGTGDSDYALSADATAVADLAEVALTSISDPGSSSGHVLRFRVAKDAAGGDSIQVGVRLYCGATFIAERWLVDPADGVYELELTGAEADAITNYADLRVRYGVVK